MSKVTEGFEEKLSYDLISGSYSIGDVDQLLAHARALEEAMTIIIDVVKSEKPSLSLVHFEKLLE